MDHLDSTLRPTDWNLTRLLRAAVDNPVYITKVGMINSFNSRIQLLDPSSYVLRTWMDHTIAAAGTHPNLEGEPIKIQSSCSEDGVSLDNLEWHLADGRIWESGVFLVI